MTISLDLPETVLTRLSQTDGGVEEETKRTLVCGLYREGRLSATEAMESLHISSRATLESLIAQYHAVREWLDDEVESELATIERLNRA